MIAAALLLLSPQALGEADWGERVLPLLRTYCFDCHGDGSRKGGFAVDAYPDFAAVVADRPRWDKALSLLRSHVMPPIHKTQPTPAERAAMVAWIDDVVFHVDPARPDPGRPVLRRLNRAEYNNAVRDVFGVAARPADAFPPDDSGYGYDTVGDALTLSPSLLEKVLAAAHQVVDEATLPRPAGQAGVERKGHEVQVFRGEAVQEKSTTLLRDGAEAGVRLDIPVDAIYRVIVLGGAKGAVDLLCDGAPLHRYEPGASRTALVRLSAGPREIAVRGPLSISAFRVRGPFNPVPPELPPFLRDLLGDRATALPRLTLSGEDTEAGEGESRLDTGSAMFVTNATRWTPVAFPTAGRYRLRVKAGAQQAGDEPVRFEVRLGGRPLGSFVVRAAEQRTEWIEVEAEIDAGATELHFAFVNAVAGLERHLWIHEFLVEGPLAPERLSHEEVPACLATTARRLFRQPVAAGRFAGLVEQAKAAGQPPMATLRLGLVALLSSPSFLYWNPGEDDLALASRLAAFLWSSVPDEPLLALAERGELRRSLRPQVLRMLADPKASALTANFAGQWLELRTLDIVAPALEGWGPELAADFRRETELLFEHVLREGRPALELLTADYTFVNPRLAAHYGLSGVSGPEFRRVKSDRRGVLGHASLLTLTSHPNRTSPVKRGKFVLEKILGTPPPPAPADVPPLDEDSPAVRELTMRQKLEAHRKNPGCASCHAFMDPPGFALEHFDFVGRRRSADEGKPVDASVRLVTGEPFADWEGLRDFLVKERSDDLLRAMAEQLLTYALGRGVDYKDKHFLREIVDRTKRVDGRLQEMIVAVCESVPFMRTR